MRLTPFSISATERALALRGGGSGVWTRIYIRRLCFGAESCNSGSDVRKYLRVLLSSFFLGFYLVFVVRFYDQL